jgi:hypothetical protein
VTCGCFSTGIEKCESVSDMKNDYNLFTSEIHSKFYMHRDIT